MERKNIFLIGRRGHENDENQLTEMLAFLWQERPRTLEAWLSSLDLAHEEPIEVETQFALPSGRVPDIAIRSSEAVTFVECKLGSGFEECQVNAYLGYLGTLNGTGRHNLVMLTKEPLKADPSQQKLADKLGVGLKATRWQEMATTMGEASDDTLEGDFVQLLVSEGLVKPEPFVDSEWSTWEAGYHVVLRIETFLREVGARIDQVLPDAARKGQQGGGNRGVYVTWGTDKGAVGVDVGLGTAVVPLRGDPQHDVPVIYSFVRNYTRDREAATAAVGQMAPNQWRMLDNITSCGLFYESPALSRPIREVIHAHDFDSQVEDVLAFMQYTVGFFRANYYLPAA